MTAQTSIKTGRVLFNSVPDPAKLFLIWIHRIVSDGSGSAMLEKNLMARVAGILLASRGNPELRTRP